MALTPIFKVTIAGGKMLIQNRIAFLQHIARLKGEFELILRKKRKRISDNLRGYYFAGIVKTCAAIEGETDELRMHEVLKLRFNPKPGMFRGEPVIIGGSTKDTAMDSAEMMAYIDRIKKDYATRGIRLPDPDDYYDRSVEFEEE